MCPFKQLRKNNNQTFVTLLATAPMADRQSLCSQSCPHINVSDKPSMRRCINIFLNGQGNRCPVAFQNQARPAN